MPKWRIFAKSGQADDDTKCCWQRRPKDESRVAAASRSVHEEEEKEEEREGGRGMHPRDDRKREREREREGGETIWRLKQFVLRNGKRRKITYTAKEKERNY